jgi:hypothetical protein
MRSCARLVTTALVLLTAFSDVTAQRSSIPDTPAARSPRISLAITGGYGIPGAKRPLTRFWKGGPEAGLRLLFRAAPGFWVGMGTDVAGLWFRQTKFALAYPTVAVQKRNMAWVNLYLLTRVGFLPSASVHPYVEVAVGGSRLSGADYKQVVDSVRVTYYDIPGRMRLAMTFTCGMEIPVSRRLSFVVDAALRSVRNDENVGLGGLFQGGVRVTL